MKLVGTAPNNAEWCRSDDLLEVGDTVEIYALRFMVMDATQMPNHDRAGRYLYLLQVSGEVTKVSAS